MEGPADCSDSERRPLVVSLLDTDANMTAAVSMWAVTVLLFQTDVSIFISL